VPQKDKYLKRHFYPFNLKRQIKTSLSHQLSYQVIRLIEDYFTDKKAEPKKNQILSSNLFDLRGTPFQKRVWQELFQINSGETKTYGDLAKKIKRPKSARALGNACGANPLPILIPCHRVLGKNSLGGFSGGIHIKRKLLRHESLETC